MSFYKLVIILFPFLEKYSFLFSVVLFLIWIYKKHSKKYLLKIENKAKKEFHHTIREVNEYNKTRPQHQVEVKGSWLNIYKYKFSQINNALLLSFVFAYISFNATSYTENSNEDFFKFLTISTTLFLAGITYIQNLNRKE